MTKQRLQLVLAIILSSSIYSFSQGIVRGNISDANGETLIGVSVYLKEKISTGASTDLDGYYSFEVSSGVQHIMVVSYLSYGTIEDTIQVEDGQIVVRDFTMTSSSFTLNEVEVVAKQERSKQYYMESIKKKSASTLDYMSGDLMNRIGDNNVSAAISRVTGVATNGSFITVRGLGDRYVQTTINGSLIPTLDPFTNNIKLDLFPAGFVDNIVITKTASPDIQGDWSAAYISIETKDNPDKLTVSIESKLTFNPQYSFKKIISNAQSPTDWLGFDNGFRDVRHDRFTPVNSAPTQYEELCALGLESYYRSIGVTESWNVSSQEGRTYFKLGLVELGLLGKAYFNNTQSVNQAIAEYHTGNYQNEAFRVLNQKAETALNDFANNWSTLERTSPLNISQSITLGNQTKIFGKPLSFSVGLRYGNNVRFDPNSTFSRSTSTETDGQGNPFVIQRYEQQYVKYTAGWTGLATVNYKLNPSNSFSLLYMPNFIGANNIREGVDELRSSIYNYAYLQGQFYEERAQILYQYESEHFITAAKAKLYLSASYADGKSTAPDFKSLQYFSEDLVTYTLDKTISNVRRNFRYLDENILDLKVGAEIPIRERAGAVSKLKIGGSYQEKDREFLQHDYLLRLANNVVPSFQNGNLDELFLDEKFDIRSEPLAGQDQIDLFYHRLEDPANHAIGYSKVTSGYAMIDQSLTERIRFSGGLRAEYSDIFTDVKLFSDLGYAADDPRRRSPDIAFILSPTSVQKWNFLPSINLIYRMRADEIFPSNIRLNYSRSVARPSIREYTETLIHDFELNEEVFGNADLKFVDIDNFDIRYENYFPSSDFISVSLFYKNFRNHIELTSSSVGFTWSNADKSNVYGVEIEGKLKLNQFFEFRSNVSAVKSFTRVENRRLVIEDLQKSWVVVGIIERTMFGQAPFVVNAILEYKTPKGFSASLSYNVQGAKLVFASNNAAPDIYELPQHLFNVKVSHSLGDHFNVSVTARDILNSPMRRAYEYDTGYLLDFDYFRFGTDIAIGVAYNL